jgi:hypothetical protein
LSGATLDQRDSVQMDVAVLLPFVTTSGLVWNRSRLGTVGSLRIYSLLGGAAGASSLVRLRARRAIGPQEG